MGRRESLAILGVTSAAFAVDARANSRRAPARLPPRAIRRRPVHHDVAACAVTPNETVGPYPFASSICSAATSAKARAAPSSISRSPRSTQRPAAHTDRRERRDCAMRCQRQLLAVRKRTGHGRTFAGFQTTNASGKVTFTTVYPAGIRGRPRTFTSRSRANPTSNTRDGIFADS